MFAATLLGEAKKFAGKLKISDSLPYATLAPAESYGCNRRRHFFGGQIMRAASVLLVSGVLLNSMSAVAAEAIVIAGSDTIAPIINAEAELYRQQFPDVHFVIGEGGSAHGVEAVADGRIALGMCSRELTKDEIAAHPDLRPFPICYEGIAVIVNASNPVESLTIEQLRNVFVGKVRNWKQLSGEDRPIELVGLDQVHGTAAEFARQLGLKNKQSGQEVTFTVGGKSESTGHAARCDTHQDALALVALKAGGIGYVSMSLAHKMATEVGTIKLLQINAVPPTTENLADGRYPLGRPLLLVTSGDPTGEPAKFIDFVLGDEGQEIVRKLGFAAIGK